MAHLLVSVFILEPVPMMQPLRGVITDAPTNLNTAKMIKFMSSSERALIYYAAICAPLKKPCAFKALKTHRVKTFLASRYGFECCTGSNEIQTTLQNSLGSLLLWHSALYSTTCTCTRVFLGCAGQLLALPGSPEVRRWKVKDTA